jgi:carboxymethylenebutenolidase
MIPGIKPTGKYVELPHVVVMKFRGNKIVHEHIYWDQASLLTQIGILDSRDLPITGIEQPQKLKSFHQSDS